MHSILTEQAYYDWVKRFILFHNKLHPEKTGIEKVEEFLKNKRLPLIIFSPQIQHRNSYRY